MIIGITGTNGAGKGTVVEYLKSKGFKHFSARDIFVEEIKKRGLPVNRDSMIVVSNDLRAQRGAGFFAESAIEYAQQHNEDVVAESIRSIGEAEHLKKNGAALWAVDADTKTRYDRVIKRMSETDQVSFEKFVENEKQEWENTDPTKQNLKAVIAMADAVITNNGTQEELFAQVEAALKKIA
ncbi:MAG TPA: AAA family ATPase [Candidatus Paceibacterota bacterium]|nr:AAA family ATPase [Candidatus Paceibacterota bacterium]